MRLARVVGNVVATVKNPALDGKKILICKHVGAGGRPEGRAFLALDSIGAGWGEPVLAFDGVDAGPGDRVLVTLDGWSASWTIRRPGAAVDAAVIGVVDTVELA